MLGDWGEGGEGEGRTLPASAGGKVSTLLAHSFFATEPAVTSLQSSCGSPTLTVDKRKIHQFHILIASLSLCFCTCVSVFINVFVEVCVCVFGVVDSSTFVQEY